MMYLKSLNFLYDEIYLVKNRLHNQITINKKPSKATRK